MANSTIKTRIQLKCDTEANWKKSVLESEGGEKVSGTSFIPLRGELIVYSADMAHPFSRLKIGDGITNVVMLPFIDANTLSGTSINDIQTILTGYKTVQNIVTAPTEQDNRWVSGISQDENGRITVSYKSLITNDNSLSNTYVQKNNGEAIALSVIDELSIIDGIRDDDTVYGIWFKSPETHMYSGTYGFIGVAKPDSEGWNNSTRFMFIQNSFSSATKQPSYSDKFFFPETPLDMINSNNYEILTTKTTTSIGSENNPIFFNNYGQPQACGDIMATSIKKLEAISAAGKIGFYSNGTSTIGITITTKDNVTSYPIRLSSTTNDNAQIGIYKKVNFRENFYIWPSTATSNIGDIIFYRSSGSNETANGTKVWGSGTFGRISYEGPYTEDIDGENIEYTTNRFIFKQYSHSNLTANSYYDIFHFPDTSNNNQNNSYTILTTKQAVTIAQGGTGANTSDQALINLGVKEFITDGATIGQIPIADGNGSWQWETVEDATGHIFPSGENISNNNYRRILIDNNASINDALLFVDQIADESIDYYKVYHNGNLADLADDLMPYFQNANGVSF